MSSNHNQHNQSELNEFAASSRHDVVKVAVEEEGRCWIVALDDVVVSEESRIVALGEAEDAPEVRVTENQSLRLPGTYRLEGEGPLPEDPVGLRDALAEFDRVTEKIDYDGPVSLVFRRDFTSVEDFLGLMEMIVDEIDQSKDE